MKAKLKFSGIIVLFTALLLSMISCGKSSDVLHFFGSFQNQSDLYKVTMISEGGSKDKGFATATRPGGDRFEIIYVEKGEMITIGSTPAKGYDFARWEPDGEDVELDSKVTDPAQFKMPARDVDITVYFDAIPEGVASPRLSLSPELVSFTDRADYSVPPVAKSITIRNTGTVGSVANIKEIKLDGGDSDKFDLIAHSEIKRVSVDNGTSTFFVKPTPNLKAGTYSSAVTVEYDNKKIAKTYVEFNVIEIFTITMQSDKNGTATATRIIDADGNKDQGKTIRAVAGEQITIGASPNKGYKFAQWKVAGVNLDPQTKSSVTFAMPAADVVIEAQFEQIAGGAPYLVLVPGQMNLVSFGTAKFDSSHPYTQPAAKEITIFNTGGADAIITGIKLTNNTAFKLTDNSNITLGVNKDKIFKVQPEPKLDAGTYRDTITVTYNNGETVETYVEFKVIKTYLINIVNGTPNILNAEQGTLITINANVANLQMLNHWEVVSGDVTLSNANANPATFTVREDDVEIKAVIDTLPAIPPVGQETPYLTLSDAPVSFGSVADNDPVPTAKEITIFNRGNGDAYIARIALNSSSSAFTLTDNSNGNLAKETNRSFWVQPNLGLAAGTYRDTITVTYNGKTVETYVEFEVIQTYTISMEADANGSAIADPNRAKQGTLITITATANSGYRFEEWVITGGDVTLSSATTSLATFTLRNQAVTIKPSFERIPVGTAELKLLPTDVSFAPVTDDYDYTTVPPAETIKISNTGEGNADITGISCSGSAFTVQNYSGTLVKGASRDFTVQPNTGLAAGKYNETITVRYDNDNTVQANVHFEVIKLYNIAISGENGSATPSVSKATEGTVVTITVTPNSGYRFKEWQILEGEVTVSSNAFTVKNKDVIIKAVFELIPANTPSLELSLSPVDNFADAKYNYAQPGDKTVTITNNGSGPAENVQVSIIGSSFTWESLSSINGTSIAQGLGGSKTFKIHPNTGLTPGTYTANITVEYRDSNGTPITPAAVTSVSFTVTKADGSTVGTPTQKSVDFNKIEINEVVLVSKSDSGQTVLYRIAGGAWMPYSDFSGEFTGLDPNTSYTIEAYSQENANYNAGPISSAAIKTKAQDSFDIVFEFTDADEELKWYESESDVEVSGGIVLKLGPPENIVKVELLGDPTNTKFDNIKWYIDDGYIKNVVKQTGGKSYYLKASDFKLDDGEGELHEGLHILTVTLEIGGKPYNKTIEFKVEQ
ncbi:MAG: choice-of-anchor D domain-containing protein [Leptospirales bacterium]|nr:choice-of-anchor D domain-containing protein [Leptospirales bacterium]